MDSLEQVKTQAQADVVQVKGLVTLTKSLWARFKAALKNHFVPEAVHWYKLLSVWVYILVTTLPDAYQAAGSLGLLTIDTVPDKFKWIVRCVGIFGLYTRLVNQNVASKLAAAAAPSADAQANPAK